jgi:hypothetical protein
LTIPWLGLALSAAAVAGQGDAPLQVPADALERPAPALAARLLGRPARELTGWAGLCQLDLVAFHIRSDQSRAPGRSLEVEAPRAGIAYALTGPQAVPRADPSAGADGSCDSLGPFLNRDVRHFAGIVHQSRIAEPAEAAFAFAAFAAARTSPDMIGRSCDVRFDPRCDDVAAMMREFDARELRALYVIPCRTGAEALCIETGFPVPSPRGTGRMTIVTANRAIPADPAEIRIRALCVVAVNMMADLRGGDPC